MLAKLMLSVGCISLLLTGCGQISASPAPTTPDSPTLTVMTHDSFAVSEAAIAAFESQNNVRVQFLKSGDTGTALNKAILAKDKPLADVFYGVDSTFLSRALDEDIFDEYRSTQLESIPAEFKLDPQNRLLPVDYGDVCLNYDKAYFSAKGLAPPGSLEDLAKLEYRSLLVVQNPATSSPGLAFLLATVARFGSDGYLNYWESLLKNDVKIVNDWETAYYTEFSGSSGRGPRPIVVSYSSSPVFEMIYAETPLDAPPTGVITEGESCFRQVEFVGILAGGSNRDLAEKWVDFMLSPAYQEDLPLQMFVFPVNPTAQLDETFVKYLANPGGTAQISPEEIGANREKWLQEWNDAILR